MCLRPKSIRYLDEVTNCYQTVMVSCGKCLECAKDKQNSWFQRIYEEIKFHQSKGLKCVFSTLTYNEETVPWSVPVDYVDSRTGELCHVPALRTLRRSDVRSWIKRCTLAYRRATGKEAPRYYIIGEYGSKTFRPHYHAIFLNLSKRDWDIYYRRDWTRNFGFVGKDEVIKSGHDGLSRYLCKYVSKPALFDFYKNHQGFIEAPRVMVSNGFGKCYVDKMRNYHLAVDVSNDSKRVKVICDRMTYHFGKFNYKLSKYVYKKIFGTGFSDLESYRLRRSIAYEIQRRIDKIYSDTLRELATLYPDRDPFEMYRLFEREKLLKRDDELYHRFLDIYRKDLF